MVMSLAAIALAIQILTACAQTQTSAPLRDLRGCFTLEAPVTLANGTRVPIGAVTAGMDVLSWDETSGMAASARVVGTHRVLRSNLVQISLADGAQGGSEVTVTTTPDHPFWSVRAGAPVSVDPALTQDLYDLPADRMESEDIFQDESGRSVHARIIDRTEPSSSSLRFLSISSRGETELATLCLDQHHWFFVHGVRVHNKGCFAPSVLVTAADGTEKAIGDISVGERVMSWDESQRAATAATVLSVTRTRSNRLMDIALQTGAVITSTWDHPYWSHGQQKIVSRDPAATFSDYDLNASMMHASETFANSSGHPVSGLMQDRIDMDVAHLRPNTGSEVVTLCLDRHHWFFVHGVRVHNKGCFPLSTLVTMDDGRRKQLGNVVAGDQVLSWDVGQNGPAVASVAAVHTARRKPSDLVHFALLGPERPRHITSLSATNDHPFWSVGQNGLVSADPAGTLANYGLKVELAGTSEVFQDEVGFPVQADRAPSSSLLQLGNSTCVAPGVKDPLLLVPGRLDDRANCSEADRPGELEVATLMLNGPNHWFFANGVRVHNKAVVIGGGIDSESDTCACTTGFRWNASAHACQACAVEGFANPGAACYKKCGRRSGRCDFCGSRGKCCRAGWKQATDLQGADGCNLAQGTWYEHVCVLDAQFAENKGLDRPGADCWDRCGKRHGRCAWCGIDAFCCRANVSTPEDLNGSDACLPGEGSPAYSRCVSRGHYCDMPEPIWELEGVDFACAANPHQESWSSDESGCCCEHGFEWDAAQHECVRCAGQSSACDRKMPEGNDTWSSGGYCPASKGLHSCTVRVPVMLYALAILLGTCCASCCFICSKMTAEKKNPHNERAALCHRKGCARQHTTCVQQIPRDSKYSQGWYCDGCNRFTALSAEPFERCGACDVDLCKGCAAGRTLLVKLDALEAEESESRPLIS